MHRFVIALVATLAIPSSSLSFWAPAAADDPAPITLTERDVAASNAKAGAAYNALVSMWTKEFRRLGIRFAPPELVRYRGAIRTNCGIMAPSNASYCNNSNSIYFDDVFVAWARTAT